MNSFSYILFWICSTKCHHLSPFCLHHLFVALSGCVCDKCGTAECSHDNGQCMCQPNVEGEKCDRCALHHYGFNSCDVSIGIPRKHNYSFRFVPLFHAVFCICRVASHVTVALLRTVSSANLKVVSVGVGQEWQASLATSVRQVTGTILRKDVQVNTINFCFNFL
jgi:hypothetical protein